MIVVENDCISVFFYPDNESRPHEGQWLNQSRRESAMMLNSKGQVTIPAHLRAKYDLHAGDKIEVVDVNGALQIVRAETPETRGQRLVSRLRNTASSRDLAGLSTDEIMALLRGE
jgi:AbrB family looped-hinge helix DNA binding protein